MGREPNEIRLDLSDKLSEIPVGETVGSTTFHIIRSVSQVFGSQAKYLPAEEGNKRFSDPKFAGDLREENPIPLEGKLYIPLKGRQGHVSIDEKSLPEGSVEGLLQYITNHGGQIRQWAIHAENMKIDALTSLKRRDAFMDAAKETYEPSGTYSVILFDLDNFKGLNDTYGHGQGDNALRTVGQILNDAVRNVLRSDDRVFLTQGSQSELSLDPKNGDSQPPEAVRYGGEELLIYLPGATAEEAKAIADRVMEAIRSCDIGEPTEFNPNSQTHYPRPYSKITASAGIACSADFEGEVQLHDLISKADGALYKAKHAGRDQYIVAK